MIVLGHFWCKNRKSDSSGECDLRLKCPRAYEECDSFDPDGEAILDELVETWLYEVQKDDGISDAMANRLEAAIKGARLK